MTSSKLPDILVEKDHDLFVEKCYSLLEKKEEVVNFSELLEEAEKRKTYLAEQIFHLRKAKNYLLPN